MKRSWKMMSGFLDAVQRRMRSARPGSVLIMVVSLLVLLALIGTAAMSTARLDRVSSGQNVANTQVDLLAEGVKQMVISQLVADLTDFKDVSSNDSLRDFFNSTDSAISDPDQGTKAVRDSLIASRLPVRRYYKNNSTIFPPLAPDPIWRSISYPPFQNGFATAANSFSPYRFDPPDEPEPTTNFALNSGDANGSNYALPLYKPVFAPTSKLVQGELFPALQPVFDNGPAGLFGRPFLAADADGDGVADSLLFRLPISPIRGVTYYGAIRVVDNAAAININTAGNPNFEWVNLMMHSGAPTPVSLAGVYPASVNVDGLLNPILELPARNNQLFMGDATIVGTWSANPPPIGQMIGDKETVPGSGIYDQQDVRTDSYFLTLGDALHHQLGRRLDNPGFYDTNGMHYGGGVRPFGIGGAMTLAYGFDLINPSANNSLLEQIFYKSLLTTRPGQFAPFKPYAPNAYAAWFADNFDYGTQNDQYIRRAMLTTMNPVSNSVYRHDPLMKVKYPSKTNINTATFEELQTSFLDVMSDLPGMTPFDDVSEMTTPSQPYLGMHFDAATYAPDVTERHPMEMFRSPLRPSAAGYGASGRPLQPYEVMQLRAGIAAANAIAMRSQLDVVIPWVVPLRMFNPANPALPVQYNAIVYGMKRQPFVTEVFVSNNPEVQVPDPTLPPGPGGAKQNRSGFAAIELHNPYDDDMPLLGWSLKLVDRAGFDTKALTYTDFSTPIVFNTEIIPAHGYLVIWNYNATVSGDNDNAEYLPADIKDIPTATATTPLPVYKKSLHEMIGKEVVLLRPLVVPPAVPRTIDWAPIDSFNCTGLTHNSFVSGTPATNVEEWHYARASDRLAGRGWQFVYPGRYDGAQKRCHQGIDTTATLGPWDPTMQQDPWSPNGPPNLKTSFGGSNPLPAPPALSYDAFNTRDRGGSAVMANLGVSTFPIQIGNNDMLGRFQASGAATGVAFPMNGFARAGDVMQVPFIGSYVIYEPPAAPPAGYFPSAFVEINSVTMDAAFAEDTDVNDDMDANNYPEDIGRFSPPITRIVGNPPTVTDVLQHTTSTTDTYTTTTIVDSVRSEVNDYWKDCDLIVYNPAYNPNIAFNPTTNWDRQFRRVSGSTATGVITVANPFNPVLTAAHYTYKVQSVRYAHYGWSSDLLDYFTTIHAPADDYLPNFDPYLTGVTAPDPVKNIPDPSRLTNRGYNATTPPGLPPAVAPNPPVVTEDDVASEGLININTAGWKVLGTLPLVMGGATGTDFTQVNWKLSEQLAKRIVYYRDVDDGTTGPAGVAHPHGPFKSLLELCQIPEFVSAEGTIDVTNVPLNNPGVNRGDFSLLTNDPMGDSVRLDFKEKYLNLTRISNLVTLRSDCYTVYLQVQGWQDAGSANAKLVVQRRLAFIVDRSKVTAKNPTPTIYNVQVPASGR